MAEIELRIIGRQRISGRIPNTAILKDKLAAFEEGRNGMRGKVDRRFKTDDARIRLNKPYPPIQYLRANNTRIFLNSLPPFVLWTE